MENLRLNGNQQGPRTGRLAGAPGPTELPAPTPVAPALKPQQAKLDETLVPSALQGHVEKAVALDEIEVPGLADQVAAGAEADRESKRFDNAATLRARAHEASAASVDRAADEASEEAGEKEKHHGEEEHDRAKTTVGKIHAGVEAAKTAIADTAEELHLGHKYHHAKEELHGHGQEPRAAVTEAPLEGGAAAEVATAEATAAETVEATTTGASLMSKLGILGKTGLGAVGGLGAVDGIVQDVHEIHESAGEIKEGLHDPSRAGLIVGGTSRATGATVGLFGNTFLGMQSTALLTEAGATAMGATELAGAMAPAAEALGTFALPLLGASGMFIGGGQLIKAQDELRHLDPKKEPEKYRKAEVEAWVGGLKVFGGSLMVAGTVADATGAGAVVGVPMQLLGVAVMGGATAVEHWDTVCAMAKESQQWAGKTTHAVAHKLDHDVKAGLHQADLATRPARTQVQRTVTQAGHELGKLQHGVEQGIKKTLHDAEHTVQDVAHQLEVNTKAALGQAEHVVHDLEAKAQAQFDAFTHGLFKPAGGK